MPVPCEKDLARLLASLSPALCEEEFVFCSFKKSSYGSCHHLCPVAAIKEAEGLTLIIPRKQADQHQITYAAVFKKITLQVQSSLEAVGLTAVIAKTLTDHGISANVVAGYFHDHIFVPENLADKAMAALQGLTRSPLPDPSFRHDISKTPRKK